MSIRSTWITTTDYHTAGEPFRIVSEGVPALPGTTVAERRMHAIDNHGGIDELRQLLVNEPRGHADMYGGFIMPPNDAGAHFGVLFWHKDGFSTACGHGTIALGVWATDTGLVESDPDGVTEVRIDVPSGRVSARVRRSGGNLVDVTFTNVPSYVIARGLEVETSRGTVHADLSYGGAIYASVVARDVGLTVDPEHYTDLIAVGREVKWALNDHPLAQHEDDRLSGVYGTILFDELPATEIGPAQRNITVFADGEVDRSPCGSGTGARVALLADSGVLGPTEVLTHTSIVDSEFTAVWREHEPSIAAPIKAPAQTRRFVIPETRGTAHLTGKHSFWLDPADVLGTGFTLR